MKRFDEVSMDSISVEKELGQLNLDIEVEEEDGAVLISLYYEDEEEVAAVEEKIEAISSETGLSWGVAGEEEEEGVIVYYLVPHSEEIEEMVECAVDAAKTRTNRVNEMVEERLAEGDFSVNEEKSEKEVATGMKAKGYKMALVPTAGDDERALYAKIPALARELQDEEPDKKYKIMPIDKYIDSLKEGVAEMVEERISENTEE